MYCSYSTHLNLWRESESLSVCIWRDDTCVWEILVGTRVLQLRVKSAQAAVKVQQLTITVSKPWPLNCSTSVCRPCIHKCICAREREVGWTPHCSLYANADESITESYLETKQCSSQCSNNVACHCLKQTKATQYCKFPVSTFLNHDDSLCLTQYEFCWNIQFTLFTCCALLSIPCTMCLQYISKTRCSGLEGTPPALIIPNGKHTFQKLN